MHFRSEEDETGFTAMSSKRGLSPRSPLGVPNGGRQKAIGFAKEMGERANLKAECNLPSPKGLGQAPESSPIGRGCGG
jgi:hypothetical protein